MSKENYSTKIEFDLQCGLVKVLLSKYCIDNLFEMIDKKKIYHDLMNLFDQYLTFNVDLTLEYEQDDLKGQVHILCEDGQHRFVDFYISTHADHFFKSLTRKEN